ncbi:hypothetical protein ACTMS0_05285 [Micromonospora sp. H33]|uniref:hypothetical protein n=1 Tax=Micromonospora sp. H33 TaxID=3452215 RepID=UPI003F899BF3
MPEHDTGPNLNDIFTAYTSGGPLVAPPGAAAAQQVARRRRTARIAAAGVLAMVLAAAPAFAATWVDPDPPAPPGNTATPSASASSPPPSPTPSSTSTPAAPPPDGRIGEAELGDATLELPAWPTNLKDYCPAGQVRFSDGRAKLSPDAELDVRIVQVVHADLDRDGAQETAALIICSGLEMSESRVLAFDRTTDGRIATMGLVTGETDGIAGMRRIRAKGTAVEVEVVDAAGDGVADGLAQPQWRSYSWSDGRFVQSGGPTAFPANPRVTDLSVSGGDVRLTPDGADTASGTLRLTVGNEGPQRATEPRLRVTLPTGFEITSLPPDCTTFVFARGTDYTCQLPTLAVGGSFGVDLPVSLRRSPLGSGKVGEWSAKVVWSPGDGEGAPYPEPDGAEKDNSARGGLAVAD